MATARPARDMPVPLVAKGYLRRANTLPYISPEQTGRTSRAADVAEIARLAAAEKECCGFFRFALVIDGRGVALEVHAPPEAADVVTALFGGTR